MLLTFLALCFPIRHCLYHLREIASLRSTLIYDFLLRRRDCLNICRARRIRISYLQAPPSYIMYLTGSMPIVKTL